MVYDIFHVLFIKVRTVICDYIIHKTFQPEQNLRPRLWTFDEIRKQRISVSLGRVHLHLSQKNALPQICLPQVCVPHICAQKIGTL